MDKTPLKLEEFEELAGKPVYIEEDGEKIYGIVEYETIGNWAGIPFIVGVWHENGISVNFKWNVKDRELKCYRLDNI